MHNEDVLEFMYLGQADISSSNVFDQRMGDPMRRIGELSEGRNGMVEYMEYSEIRNILRDGIYKIF